MPTGNDNPRVWFITGCSTGLGRALAERVLQRGQRCVVTARNPAQIGAIAAPHPTTALAIELDVTRQEQLERAVARTESVFGRIDVLVNNAGYGYLAAVEEGEDSEVRAMFETNFFGVAALLRLALPAMRARGSGHVVNISSVGGLVGTPGVGYYNATKFALEGLTQALALELRPHGIRVTSVEPGPFRTDWSGRSLRMVRSPMAAYEGTFGARRAQILAGYGKQPGDPVRAADAIIDVVESTDPPLNLVLGRIGLERVREKLADMQRSIDAWESLSLGTDYPQP